MRKRSCNDVCYTVKIRSSFWIQRSTTRTRSACTMVCLRSKAKVSFVVTISDAANTAITDLSYTIGRVETVHLREYNC